jgi:WD40 repeat protein/biotin carboxyl carrier protein
MWRVVALTLGALLICGVALWWARAGVSSAEPAADAPSAPEPRPVARQPASSPEEVVAPGEPLRDAVVISSCSLVPVQEQDVSSQVDGVLQDVVVDLGARVGRGELLGRLDDRLLRPQVELLRIKAASESAKLIAKAQYDEVELKTETAEKLLAKGVTPSLEYRTYTHQRERYVEEMKKAREDQEVARKELDRALRMLELHEIRSSIVGEVTKVYKRKGESVRQMEPLFRVGNFNRLCVEGLCKAAQADLLRVGMRAVVEPELASEQLRELSGHTAAVDAVAVSPDGRLLATASEDRTAALWSWPGAVRRAILPHPAEVHAVALGRAAAGQAGYRLLTGAADGMIRAWLVSAGGAVSEPIAWEGGHEGAVRCLALSPDGRWCASAGEDRRVGLWELATGNRLAWLQDEASGKDTAHQGAVTWVQFAPDGCLVSAGRDNVLNVWRLGDGGARVVATQPGRAGDVAAPGVSSDGKRVLFDRGDELRILDRDGGGCLGSLRGRRQGRFQGFALFSPTDRLILAGSSNGRLQLWKVPADPETAAFFRRGYAHGFRRDSLNLLGALGNLLTPSAQVTAGAALSAPTLPQLWALDGYEVRHFLTPSTATALCGAFAPDESVVFTGCTDGAVRVWAVPPAAQWTEPWEATITFVAGQVERGTDGVRVRAELENPADPGRRLRPGTYADLRLYPETAPARP